METQEVFLTNDGRRLALSQLESLRTVGRAKVAQNLHEAMDAGDVIDNAAYEDAKNEQARLEGRIYELEQLLARAKVIKHVPTHLVSLGSNVRVRIGDDRECQYTIVGAFEASPSAGRISNESPVGKALLGHRAGDQVIVSTPGGVKGYTILAVD
ncbi:MAG: transcription elongation factor GreA [Ktedonobacteraceae bacterium]|nr:transcription elongation factor GreA [Ktedonobacteraceae bacterium]